MATAVMSNVQRLWVFTIRSSGLILDPIRPLRVYGVSMALSDIVQGCSTEIVFGGEFF